MSDALSIDELSARTGEPAGRLRRWRQLGLIGSGEASGFTAEDVERAKLVQLLLRRGIGVEAIARVEKESGLLRRYFEVLFPAGVGRAYSLAEAAEAVGIELDLVKRLWTAAGFIDQGDTATEGDLEGLRLFRDAMGAGFPEEAMLQLVRVYADALGKVAEAETRLFHFYIHEGLRTRGLSRQDLAQALREAGDAASPLTEPAVLFFHRKGWERAMRHDIALDVAAEAGLLSSPEVPGQMGRAVLFSDLSSFTPLAEAMGDVEAARVLERFADMIREAAVRWDGRVVKQIGDAFMLVFGDSPSAVACALEIEGRATAEPQFPAARSGVHWGQVLYREGDYIGANVNIAARLAAEAQRHQIVVSEEVRKQAKELPGVQFVPLGKRRLKGLSEPLALFEARPLQAEAREKTVDPVCGMELGPSEIAARLSLEGSERAFCSEECLRRFVAAPERYTS